MNQQSDEYYMRLAVKEAKKGLGRTSPNPCVGAAIVRDGEVIATGYHRKAGTPHAEIHALNCAGKRAVNATMYVTLEPCNHTGRTPPCTQAIVAAGIKKVVIGMLDPNPLVNGSGVQFLRQKKIKVESGILADNCRELINPFIKMITSELPWVAMKAGLSLDGRLSYQHGCGGAITGVESHRKVHQMRNETDAILVGIGTVEADNPSLTTRLTHKKGKDPVRIILDSSLRISENAKILHLDSSLAPTWIFCSKKADSAKVDRLSKAGTVIHCIDHDANGLSLEIVLRKIADHGLSSLLVEGGSKVHGAFLRGKYVDRVHLFYAPVFAGDQGVSLADGLCVNGGKKKAITLARIATRRYGDDVMISGDVVYPG